MKQRQTAKAVILFSALVLAAPMAGTIRATPEISLFTPVPVRTPPSVTSPDGTIAVTIRGTKPLTCSVSVDRKTVLSASRLGLRFRDGTVLGADARVTTPGWANAVGGWENELDKRRRRGGLFRGAGAAGEVRARRMRATSGNRPLQQSDAIQRGRALA